MEYVAVVRGKPIDVKEEAEKRGLNFEFKNYQSYLDETLCYLSGSHIDIQKWFSENPKEPPPYSSGTILFYNTLKGRITSCPE